MGKQIKTVKIWNKRDGVFAPFALRSKLKEETGKDYISYGEAIPDFVIESVGEQSIKKHIDTGDISIDEKIVKDDKKEDKTK